MIEAAHRGGKVKNGFVWAQVPTMFFVRQASAKRSPVRPKAVGLVFGFDFDLGFPLLYPLCAAE
jgi:hypothetical protein